MSLEQDHLGDAHLGELHRLFPVMSPQERVAPAEVAMYHDRLTQLVDSLRNSEAIALSFEGVISHGAWRKTKDYFDNTGPGKTVFSLRDELYTTKSILAEYAEQSEFDQGNNLGNVLTTANALDRALHDPERQRAIVREVAAWGKSTSSLDQKLNSFPGIGQVIWEAAVILHSGYSFGRNNPESTWVHTTSVNRAKSYVVAAALVNNLIHYATGQETGIEAAKNVRLPTFHEIRKLADFDKPLTPYYTEMSLLWDSVMTRVRFRHDINPYKALILGYRDVLMSSDPLVSQGQRPMTSEEATQYIIRRVQDYASLTSVDLAGLQAHQSWQAGQTSQVVRYRPGQLFSSRDTQKAGGQDVKVDPRNTHFVFLAPGDILNNVRAAYALFFIGQSRVMSTLKEGKLPSGREGFNVFLQAMLFDYQVHGSMYSGNPMLEGFASVVHDPWMTATLMREGIIEARNHRYDQIQLYRDLDNATQSWDRIAVCSALPPFIAGVMKHLENEGNQRLMVPEISPLLDPLLRSARIVK
jgi:hypothetical protein